MHALGDGVLEQVEDVAQAAQRVGHRARRRLQHVGPAAQLRHAHEQVGVAGGEVQLAHLALEADEVLASRARCSRRSRCSSSTPRPLSSAGYSAASPRPTR